MRNKKLRCESCFWWGISLPNGCSNPESKHYGKVLPLKNIACPKYMEYKDPSNAYRYQVKKANSDFNPKKHTIMPDIEPGAVIKRFHEQEDNKLYKKEVFDKVRKEPKRQKISPLSNSKKVKKAKIYAIKAKYKKMFQERCFVCGKLRPGHLQDAFHIYPIGKFPEYETESWNIVPSCRSCNHKWDQGTIEEIMNLPNIDWLLWTIWNKDNDPNKLHKGSFYEQLMNRKNKS